MQKTHQGGSVFTKGSRSGVITAKTSEFSCQMCRQSFKDSLCNLLQQNSELRKIICELEYESAMLKISLKQQKDELKKATLVYKQAINYQSYEKNDNSQQINLKIPRRNTRKYMDINCYARVGHLYQKYTHKIEQEHKIWNQTSFIQSNPSKYHKDFKLQHNNPQSSANQISRIFKHDISNIIHIQQNNQISIKLSEEDFPSASSMTETLINNVKLTPSSLQILKNDKMQTKIFSKDQSLQFKQDTSYCCKTVEKVQNNRINKSKSEWNGRKQSGRSSSERDSNSSFRRIIENGKKNRDRVDKLLKTIPFKFQ